MSSRVVLLCCLSLAILPAMELRAEDSPSTPASTAAQNVFTISEYRILGNTALPAATIEVAVYPHLGDHKTIDDIEVVRQLLEKLYKDHGFGTVYVDIPEQSVTAGIVRLKVTEGRLDRVRISGAKYFANGRIRSTLSALQPGTVLSLPTLQNQLGAVNQQSRDRMVTPVLKAGRSPGTVDVELKVQDSLPFHGSAEVNNRYSANTTHTRASINLSYDNLFQKFHSLSLQYQTSPEELDETRVIAATYLAPLQDGDMLAVYAVDTNSDFAVVNTGGDLSVLGTGNIYGLRYFARLPSKGGYSHNLALGADYKDFSDSIVLTEATDVTPIRYMSWSVSYGGVQTGVGNSTSFNVGPIFGIRGLVNDQEQFVYKRTDGKANFFYLRGDLSHLQRLWADTAVFLKFTGQWSPEPLISNEQYAVGGADGVRGYMESALMGDRGIGGVFELRAPSMHRWLGKSAKDLTLFVFYDAARVIQLAQIDDGGNVVKRDGSVSSTGAGVRFNGLGGLEAALDWAYPLKSLGEVERGDSRIHFKVRYAF